MTRKEMKDTKRKAALPVMKELVQDLEYKTEQYNGLIAETYRRAESENRELSEIEKSVVEDCGERIRKYESEIAVLCQAIDIVKWYYTEH